MQTTTLGAIARSIRSLSADAIQKANSGHPGLPLGMAELGGMLFAEILEYYPDKPDWIDRDRFILSAGHGSMLLYSLLHLAGYKLSCEDLMNFRQTGSITPGHPEYGLTPGVETTTGPLGAGFSNAVGMAIAESMLAAQFNTNRHQIVDHYTFVIAGDGCMMEGITSEAASLAGHLALDKLIVFYDSNQITIEGSTDIAFSEDVLARYQSYNWQTLTIDAYNGDEIRTAVNKAKSDTTRPTLIRALSTIGKGAPTMAGTHKVHGSPLGEEEILRMRKESGIPDLESFFIDPEASSFFVSHRQELEKKYREWENTFTAWSKDNPQLRKKWDVYFSEPQNAVKNLALPDFKIGDKIATRKASGKILNTCAEQMENIVGGSADLAPSNNTFITSSESFSATNRKGRNLHFGVREHAMGGIINGMVLHGGLKVYCGTFLAFSDYMRPAIRLAALMKIPSIFVFTHDSIFVGEDGPTHQPIEHIEALRAIPDLTVIRPADAEETAIAWKIAIAKTDGPCVLILSRQSLPVLGKHDPDWKAAMLKGAYIVSKGSDHPDITIVATGSEVSMALEAAALFTEKNIRVISMPSRTDFLDQDVEYRSQLIPEGTTVIAVEAGVPWGWASVTGNIETVFSIRRFGESGPADRIASSLGFTVQDLKEFILSKTDE